MSKKNDWPEVWPDPETEYEQTDITLEDLAIDWRGVKGCSYGNLCKRYANNDWKKKRAAYRQQLTSEIRKATIETKTKAVKRWISDYRALQEKAKDAIKSEEHSFDDLKAAATALDMAIKGEASLRGQEMDGEKPTIRIIIEGDGKPKEADVR